jgi:hypothetical protein
MNINVFVSRPNAVDDNQKETIIKIESLLIERGIHPRTIGSTDFPNVSPMKAVEKLMKQCSGAVILGIPQTYIKEGISKQNTKQESQVKDKLLPTPWNQIEASMAFMLDLPLLIIRHDGINGGIFDIGTTGHYIHTFDVNDQYWIKDQSFLQPFNEWYNCLIKHTD